MMGYAGRRRSSFNIGRDFCMALTRFLDLAVGSCYPEGISTPYRRIVCPPITECLFKGRVEFRLDVCNKTWVSVVL